LHIYHRYKEEGAGSIAFVLKHTGPPIFMASLTTVIGFTGVLMTTHKGLQSIGILAIIAMSLCFLASISFFPAVLRVLERLKVRI
ncbi:MAG: MMPL family transporter, partial [Deltaproteobacteria bacterium]|nr:MMPL family transporter [Deltaproteobacteria bacterium]